jgi:hypothetical protein
MFIIVVIAVIVVVPRRDLAAVPARPPYRACGTQATRACSGGVKRRSPVGLPACDDLAARDARDNPASFARVRDRQGCSCCARCRHRLRRRRHGDAAARTLYGFVRRCKCFV